MTITGDPNPVWGSETKMIKSVMNTKHISSAALAIVAVLAACTKNPIGTPSASCGPADLELTSVNSTLTKAAIDGTTFPTDGMIGLFLFADEAADTPYGDGYENVNYTYNSTKEKWTASPSIKVGSTPGYLYGYYPYSSSATDVKAIPVASSLDGDDVMYASPVKNVTDQTASQTAITMNHALARVAITVVNKGYTGAAKLSSIKFSGAGTAAAGTLDALDGTITATKSDVTLDVPAASQDITAAGTTFDCLLVPSKVETGRQDVSLTLTIDGQEKSATLSGDNGVIIARNTKSNITITLSNSGISVRTVSVQDWKVVEAGGHKVTVQIAEGIDANDILTNAYVDGDDVIIRALSDSGHRLKCTISEGELCSSQSKTAYLSPEDPATISKFDYTFTISDITDDIVATISYANAVSINASPDPVDGGSIGIEGELYEGETVSLTVRANEGYGLARWQDRSGNILCENEEYSFRPSAEEVSVTAVFRKLINLKIYVSPTCAGNVSAFDSWNVKGTEISLTTTPCGNSVFKAWKDKDGNILTDKNTYTFTIESDTVLIAEYSASCGEDALSGVFTVAEDNGCGKPKKVRFSKGNLYWDGNNMCFNFEVNQYDFQKDWNATHVSYFYWTKDASVSHLSTYSDPQASRSDVFFTNSGAFAVNGVSLWHTLSAAEWKYLLGGTKGTVREGKHKANVKVNDKVGLVIAPDEFSGTIADSYTSSEWKEAEAAGLVFLPVAGRHIGYSDYLGNLDDLDDGFSSSEVGCYWSATSIEEDRAASLKFLKDLVNPTTTAYRSQGCSVRLVAEYESETSAE